MPRVPGIPLARPPDPGGVPSVGEALPALARGFAVGSDIAFEFAERRKQTLTQQESAEKLADASVALSEISAQVDREPTGNRAARFNELTSKYMEEILSSTENPEVQQFLRTRIPSMIAPIRVGISAQEFKDQKDAAVAKLDVEMRDQFVTGLADARSDTERQVKLDSIRDVLEGNEFLTEEDRIRYVDEVVGSSQIVRQQRLLLTNPQLVIDELEGNVAATNQIPPEKELLLLDRAQSRVLEIRREQDRMAAKAETRASKAIAASFLVRIEDSDTANDPSKDEILAFADILGVSQSRTLIRALEGDADTVRDPLYVVTAERAAISGDPAASQMIENLYLAGKITEAVKDENQKLAEGGPILQTRYKMAFDRIKTLLSSGASEDKAFVSTMYQSRSDATAALQTYLQAHPNASAEEAIVAADAQINARRDSAAEKGSLPRVMGRTVQSRSELPVLQGELDTLVREGRLTPFEAANQQGWLNQWGDFYNRNPDAQ